MKGDILMIQNREALLGPLSEAVRQAGRLFDDRAMAGQIRQKGPTDFVRSEEHTSELQSH